MKVLATGIFQLGGKFKSPLALPDSPFPTKIKGLARGDGGTHQ